MTRLACTSSPQPDSDYLFPDAFDAAAPSHPRLAQIRLAHNGVAPVVIAQPSRLEATDSVSG